MTHDQRDQLAREVARQLEDSFRQHGIVTTLMYDLGIPIISAAIKYATDQEKQFLFMSDEVGQIVRRAVAEEREACALEAIESIKNNYGYSGEVVALGIRSRK